MTLEPRLLEALSAVQDPELRRPITELGMVESAILSEGTARVTVLLTIAGCPMRSTIENDVAAALSAVPGVGHVEVTLGVMSPEQRAAIRACKAALTDDVDAETARGIVVAFARKKDILIEDGEFHIPAIAASPSHIA